ncbi:MAG: hypothetical protein V3R24_01395, partial [Gemmatimonadales bacterium]
AKPASTPTLREHPTTSHKYQSGTSAFGYAVTTGLGMAEGGSARSEGSGTADVTASTGRVQAARGRKMVRNNE